MKKLIKYRKKNRKSGFSLVEVLISTVLAVVVTGALISSLLMNLSGQRITRSHNRNLAQGNEVLNRLVYGWDDNIGLRQVADEDFSVVIEGPNIRLLLGDGKSILYQRVAQRVVNQDGVIYGRFVSNFSAVKGNSNVQLGLTVEDRSLARPTVQNLSSRVAFRNDS